MSLEISKLSHQKPGKRKNGDFCEFKVMEKENLVVLNFR